MNDPQTARLYLGSNDVPNSSFTDLFNASNGRCTVKQLTCDLHSVALDISREENAVVLSGGAARAPLIARDSLLKKRQLARIFWTALIVELI